MGSPLTTSCPGTAAKKASTLSSTRVISSGTKRTGSNQKNTRINILNAGQRTRGARVSKPNLNIQFAILLALFKKEKTHTGMFGFFLAKYFKK